MVAFSGGPDSTALLSGLVRLGRRWPLRLLAAHLDHGIDAGSARRAAAAARLARSLGAPFVAERREIPTLRRTAESLEEAARRVRYAFLAEVADRAAARYVATAHHLDDQAETVLLRFLYGSGLAGLGGIRPRHGRIVRPLLALRRRDLSAALVGSGLEAVDDPTNRSPEVARNRVRSLLLPALAAAEGDPAQRLARLAEAARGAAERIDARLRTILRPRAGSGTAAVRRTDLANLPGELLASALALLHREAGAPYPAGRATHRELLRQMARGARIGCDCGGGWRWEERDGWIVLRHLSVPAPLFPYTLRVKGERPIEEDGVRPG